MLISDHDQRPLLDHKQNRPPVGVPSGGSDNERRGAVWRTRNRADGRSVAFQFFWCGRQFVAHCESWDRCCVARECSGKLYP